MTGLEQLKRVFTLRALPDEIHDGIWKATSYDELKAFIKCHLDIFSEAENFVIFDKLKNDAFLRDNLERLLDALDVGLWVIDENENYVYVNQALLDLSETLSKEAILGSYCRSSNMKFDILMPDIVKTEARSVTAFQDVTNFQTGAHYRQLVTQSPVYDEHGKLKYIVAVVEKLSHLNARLQEAQSNHMKYIIGHAEENSSNTMIAESPQMKELIKSIKQIAPADVPILIEGESGTGKEVVANEIHKNSGRADKPLVAVNCSAIPESLFESELFGYEKGAFTGANQNGKIGLLEQANGGTLFLDEINSMPLAVQGKLLRALETRSFKRLGGTKDIFSDFRIISATNQNLFELCKEKLFRDDLFYRLNIIPIRIPPLRNRKEDIIPLTEYFLDKFSSAHNTNKAFSSSAIEEIMAYDWPGNVRELRNFVERAIVMSGSNTVEISNISNIITTNSYETIQLEDSNQQPKEELTIGKGFSLSEYINDCEKKVIQKAMEMTSTSYEAADLLDISQSTFIKKKQKHGL